MVEVKGHVISCDWIIHPLLLMFLVFMDACMEYLWLFACYMVLFFFYVHWLIFVCSNTPKHDLGNGGNVLKIQQEKQCGGTLMCSYSKGFTYVQNEWSISPNNLFLVVYTNSV